MGRRIRLIDGCQESTQNTNLVEGWPHSTLGWGQPSTRFVSFEEVLWAGRRKYMAMVATTPSLYCHASAELLFDLSCLQAFRLCGYVKNSFDLIVTVLHHTMHCRHVIAMVNPGMSSYQGQCYALVADIRTGKLFEQVFNHHCTILGQVHTWTLQTKTLQWQQPASKSKESDILAWAKLLSIVKMTKAS